MVIPDFKFKKEVLNFGMMSIYASYVKIGTNTLRHEYGYNNFTHRQKALEESLEMMAMILMLELDFMIKGNLLSKLFYL